MPNSDDLKARLLAMYSHRGDGIPTQYVNPDGPEAVARIEELEGQVEGLRKFTRHGGLCAIIGGYGYCSCGLESALAATEQGKKP